MLRPVLPRNAIEYGNIFRYWTEIRENYGFGSDRGRTCLCSEFNAHGQETPVGNQRGERRLFLPGAPQPAADSVGAGVVWEAKRD